MSENRWPLRSARWPSRLKILQNASEVWKAARACSLRKSYERPSFQNFLKSKEMWSPQFKGLTSLEIDWVAIQVPSAMEKGLLGPLWLPGGPPLGAVAARGTVVDFVEPK